MALSDLHPYYYYDINLYAVTVAHSPATNNSFQMPEDGMYVCTYMYVCMYIYVCMYVCMYMYYLYYVCMYACMYVCMYYVCNSCHIMVYKEVWSLSAPSVV